MTNPNPKGPRKTRRWVLIADRTADRVITIGGSLVIFAVLGMMVFLVIEVLPLFRGGKEESHSAYRLQQLASPIIGLTIDEYRTIAVAVTRDGKVNCWHASSGKPLSSITLDFKGKQISAFSKCSDGTNFAFGFSDGTVRFAKIAFEANVLPRDGAPKDLSRINDQDATDGTAVYSLVPGDQLRKVSARVELNDKVKISDTGSPIVAMDYRFGEVGEKPRRTLVTVDGNGTAALSVAESKLNLFTNKLTTKVSKTVLPPLPDGTSVSFALVNDIGDSVYLAERGGRIYRYNTRDAEKPFFAEAVNLVPKGTEITVLGFLVGDRALVLGSSNGSVSIYFLLRREDAAAKDGMVLVLTRVFDPQPAAITGFSPSQRGKTFATSDARGGIWIRQGTSQATLLRLGDPSKAEPVQALSLAPRVNGVLAVSAGGVADLWTISIPHPEISWRTLFGKVWYEGYPEPGYTWQSTGATDAFEPKISLVPLVFGTAKATFYSLLFAVPIALLAAIYTSEFLPSSVSQKVKPVMEVMASLPSVVLGFVAALVLAPLVETWIAAILLVFAVVPLSMIFSAYLWQMLPSGMSLRLQGLPKFVVMFVVVGAALYLSYHLGPLFEKIFFQGNFKAWVSGNQGSSTPFMFLLAIPATATVVSLSASRVLGREFNLYLRRLAMPYSAMLDMLRWVGICTVTGLLAYALAGLLSAIGLDPRGSLVGTYVQRNTLVVGFAMGFAVIPIIYTLAEDALNAVPDHLRSASLGCGATPWQTAIWIVLPTALSGVFSAIMIGMGRAVGETMIVVMSAGNTPLLDMNIFNGLRALSANIAVELPEAPKDGTLYRVLFLTGLLLFAMTFVINTVAELVRLHFRKRAAQL